MLVLQIIVLQRMVLQMISTTCRYCRPNVSSRSEGVTPQGVAERRDPYAGTPSNGTAENGTPDDQYHMPVLQTQYVISQRSRSELRAQRSKTLASGEIRMLVLQIIVLQMPPRVPKPHHLLSHSGRDNIV
jgi:hypothetical protein